MSLASDLELELRSKQKREPDTISKLLVDMLSQEGESEMTLRVDKATDQLVVRVAKRVGQVDTAGEIRLCAHQASRAGRDATLRHALWILSVLD